MKQYSRDEVEEILRRALETQPLETLSHKDLVDSAVEAGIDAADVEAGRAELAKSRLAALKAETAKIEKYAFRDGELPSVSVFTDPAQYSNTEASASPAAQPEASTYSASSPNRVTIWSWAVPRPRVAKLTSRPAAATAKMTLSV